MNANDVKAVLSDNDIINIMIHLGSNYPQKIGNTLAFNTICHVGDSHKLIYYTESKTFTCYTHCGFIGSIFDVVKKVMDVEFSTSFKFVCQYFGIDYKKGFEFDIDRIDNNFIKRFNKKEDKEITLKVHDDIVLRNFNDLYYDGWINEHISIDTMKKFNIKYDILNHRIIIPHYNYKNELVGIRARTLENKEIENGRKYMPIWINNIHYNHPTQLILYGCNINMAAIKKYKTVILVESEKATMQLHSFYKDECIAVAISGSIIHKEQIKILQMLGVENVVIAMDKDFKKIGDKEELLYRAKVKKAIVEKLNPFFNLQLIWDFNGLLEYKESPTDKGKSVWNQLYKERLFLQ